jgi:hypothetical protein
MMKTPLGSRPEYTIYCPPFLHKYPVWECPTVWLYQQTICHVSKSHTPIHNSGVVFPPKYQRWTFSAIRFRRLVHLKNSSKALLLVTFDQSMLNMAMEDFHRLQSYVIIKRSYRTRENKLINNCRSCTCKTQLKTQWSYRADNVYHSLM